MKLFELMRAGIPWSHPGTLSNVEIVDQQLCCCAIGTIYLGAGLVRLDRGAHVRCNALRRDIDSALDAPAPDSLTRELGLIAGKRRPLFDVIQGANDLRMRTREQIADALERHGL